MQRRTLLLAPAVLVSGQARAAEMSVTIDNFVFTPETLTIPAGTRVTWTNQDDIPHLVVSANRPPDFKSPVLDTDEHFARVFETPGTYVYFCGLHPHMKGTIVVT